MEPPRQAGNGQRILTSQLHEREGGGSPYEVTFIASESNSHQYRLGLRDAVRASVAGGIEPQLLVVVLERQQNVLLGVGRRIDGAP